VSKVDVLLGLQWGDEGKGKIVDVLARDYDIVARFQGGPNAGHTLVFDDKKYVLHSIPSGIFQDDTTNLIGNGVVLDPLVLQDEVAMLKQAQLDVTNKLLISKKTHLILPTHKLLDAAYEKRKGKAAIGSTLRGIGPTYTDKTARIGIRVGDVLLPDFEEKLAKLIEKHIELLDWMGFPHDIEASMQHWYKAIELLRSLQIVDGEYYLREQLNAGKRILAEGAQGTLLDIEFGSYPYVTSSTTIASGACTGLGIAPSDIGSVFGVFKAYCTRVGGGLFPTELDGDIGETMQRQGNEFGATTGRERRCGWLDIVALKYACMLSGVSELYMMKSDVLSGFDEVKLCKQYMRDGKKQDTVPFNMNDFTEPVYKVFPGWQEDISGVKEWNSIPEQMRAYTAYIEDKVGLPISVISVGPDRKQTINKA
jgi:adenylosuccinate synthase